MTRDEIANMATRSGWIRKGPHYQQLGMANLELFVDMLTSHQRNAMTQALREIDFLPWATVKRVLEVVEGVK